MKSREILIYLAIKYAGNWNSIFDFIASKEEPDENDAKKYLPHQKSKVVTIMDDDYPEHLKHFCKPPFVLFYHGDISLIKDKNKCISVVGARDFNEYGLEVTQYLVKDLCKEFVIVSGMARGIDGISHRTAIENGGKTVAVLGCGINVCYPPSNLDIYDEMKKHHLIISEYPDLTEPNPLNFPVRNRIVAFLSRGVLVTQAERNSGTSITATLVLESGGSVCCVPSPIGQNSLCNHLIAYGAALVENVDDIYYELGYTPHKPIFENLKNS